MEDFNKFLKKLQEKERQEVEQKSEFNPEERIAYFQNLVNQFFNTLESDWFGEYVSKELMSIEKGKCLITEETLGQYYTDKCKLKLGGEIIEFIPVGTLLLGTDARIDMIYKQTKVMFIHVGENIKGASDLIVIRVNGETISKKKDPGQKVWKFIYKNSRELYMDANKESVLRLIMDVINEKA